MNAMTDCPLCIARGKTWNGGDHAGNLFPAAIAIERLLRSRGLTLDSYEAVHKRRQTWVCETSKGRRWVTCRDGHWATWKEEPTC